MVTSCTKLLKLYYNLTVKFSLILKGALGQTTAKQQNIKLELARASSRLKYRFDLGSGSAKFIFSGLPPVQVFRRLILRLSFG